MDITILIGGAAGQGIQTIGALLSAACRRAGYFAMAVNDFESRVRGGHSFFQIRISNAPVYAPKKGVDLLIALDETTWQTHQSSLVDQSVALANEDYSKAGRVVPAAFDLLAKETGSKLFVNTVAAAAGLRVLGAEFYVVSSIIKDHFSSLKQDMLKKNLDAAEKVLKNDEQRKFVAVEMNAGAQFAGILKEKTDQSVRKRPACPQTL